MKDENCLAVASIASESIAAIAPPGDALPFSRGPALRWLGAGLLAAGLFAAGPAAADTFRFTSNGTFSASTPVSFFSAPDGNWSISFNFDPGLMPFLPELGQYFGVGFWDFSLTVNGIAVPNQPAVIAFYNSANSGGIDLFFNDSVANPNDPAEGFSFYGPQVYTGSEFAPSIVPGTYTTFLAGNDGFQLLVNDVAFPQGEVQFTIAAIPLPPGLLLGLTGLGLIGVVARRGRRRA